jgi:hypothetical protein
VPTDLHLHPLLRLDEVVAVARHGHIVHLLTEEPADRVDDRTAEREHGPDAGRAGSGDDLLHDRGRVRGHLSERSLGAVEVGVPEPVGLELLPERERGRPRFLGHVVGCGHAEREILDLDLEGPGSPAEQPHRGIVSEQADAPEVTVNAALG